MYCNYSTAPTKKRVADVLGLNKPIKPGCLVNSEEKPINQYEKTHVIINLLLGCYDTV